MTSTVAPPASGRAPAPDRVPTVPAKATTMALGAWGLVVALVALLPVAVIRVPWAADGALDDFNRRITLSAFDAVLAVVLVRWTLRLRRRDWRRPSPLTWVGIALAVDLLAALVVHPSPLGVVLALRVLAGWAVVDTMVEAGVDRRRHLLAGLVAVGVAQAVLGMAQSWNGGPLGLGALEFAGRLYPFGTSFAGRGGFDHPYHLACLLVVAIGAALLGLRDANRRWPWLAAIGVLAAGTATTYSRSALVGLLALVGACLVAGGRRREASLLLAAVAVAAGLAVGATGFGDGWVAKGEQSTQAKSLDSARRTRLAEAGRLIKRNPVLGVGPGNYVVALADVQHDELLPAHDLFAQEAAEGGVVAGVLSGLLLVGLGWRCWRRGAWSLAIFVTLAPFFVLDAYPYVFATGLVISAVWLGLIALEGRPAPSSRRAAELDGSEVTAR